MFFLHVVMSFIRKNPISSVPALTPSSNTSTEKGLGNDSIPSNLSSSNASISSMHCVNSVVPDANVRS